MLRERRLPGRPPRLPGETKAGFFRKVGMPMKAVYIEQTGGPQVLRFGDRPVPDPGKGEVLVKLAASGVNFTDLNARSGINKVPLPAILGSEGAGTVERVAEGVTGFQPGDRVAYCMARGSYAEYAAVPANMLVPIPK